jgi:hypothetical protein
VLSASPLACPRSGSMIHDGAGFCRDSLVAVPDAVPLAAAVPGAPALVADAAVKCGSIGSDCWPDPLEEGVDVVAVIGPSVGNVRNGEGATNDR